MSIEIRRYSPGLAEDWSQVLTAAKNAVFLFDRKYIEYHGDRFEDASLIAYESGTPVAIVPGAIEKSGVISSHPGLTFGGIVLDRRLRSGTSIEIVDAVLGAWRSAGGNRCLFKMLPPLFASYPASEIDYALWRRGFKIVRRDLSSVLPLGRHLPFNSSKHQAVKKARKAGLLVKESPVDDFYELLEQVLLEQHGVAPVHSKVELRMLKANFPQQIFVRGGWLRGRLVAGAIVFNYGHVWHTQYLASSGDGREIGALDAVIDGIIDEAASSNTSFISFGVSTVNEGMDLNSGLLWQKESYGARSIVHDFMESSL